LVPLLCLPQHCRFHFVERVLRAQPGLLTLGIFSANPDRESLSKKEAHWDFIVTTSDRKVQRARITTPDPGYTATSAMVVASAVEILRQGDTIPNGVITPATAFGETDYLKLLDKRGIRFSILQ